MLIGEEHLSKDPKDSGYDLVSKLEGNQADKVAPAAIEPLNHDLPQPFFLSVGFFETHRDFLKPGSIGDIKYSLPPVPPHGAELNDPDDMSASYPTHVV